MFCHHIFTVIRSIFALANRWRLFFDRKQFMTVCFKRGWGGEYLNADWVYKRLSIARLAAITSVSSFIVMAAGLCCKTIVTFCWRHLSRHRATSSLLLSCRSFNKSLYGSSVNQNLGHTNYNSASCVHVHCTNTLSKHNCGAWPHSLPSNCS